MVQYLQEFELPSEAQEPMDEASGPSSQAQDVARPFKRQIVWFNAIGFLVMHLAGVYGVFIAIFQAKLLTLMWAMFLSVVTGQGIGMGAHRLFSHKSFKATTGLKIALLLFQTIAGQNCLWVWARDHRQHHKYSDTDADPHNARRGFFFSHIGWLMCKKHPDVLANGKNVNMSDLEADPFVMFQKRYYKTLYTIFSVVLPTVVPVWLWGETLFNGFMVGFVARTVITLNFTWLVNSAAHKFGNRPYTKDIIPVESFLASCLTMGEGWHNYHHTFPWDCRASELGRNPNLTTTLLDLCEKRGWAYDLRKASGAMITHRVLRRGDGSHPLSTPAPHPEEQVQIPAPVLEKEVERLSGEKEEPIRELLRRPGA